MAPEQAAGYEATKASDWYAVGVVLFQALTGRAPFVGSIPGVLLAQADGGGAARGEPRARGADRSRELADALLARDPTKRPTRARSSGGSASSLR